MLIKKNLIHLIWCLNYVCMHDPMTSRMKSIDRKQENLDKCSTNHHMKNINNKMNAFRMDLGNSKRRYLELNRFDDYLFYLIRPT